MSYEYMHRSVSAQGLEEFLNAKAKEGWRLFEVHFLGLSGISALVIMERKVEA